MSKVARFDSGAGVPAYAAIDLGSDQSEVWVEFRMWSDADAQAAQGQSIWTWPDGEYPNDLTTTLQSGIGPDPGPGAGGPILVEYHYVDGGAYQLYHDGVAITDDDPSGFTGLVRTVALPLLGTGFPLGVVLIDDVKIGTTRHGTDLFADDFEDGTFDAWTSTEGDASIIDAEDPPAESESGYEGRVLIAFDDGPLVAEPTWTRIDDVANLVADIEITAGKQEEFDESETNHATIRLNDRTGDFDPNNASGPYFGNMYGKQIMLQLFNPVDETWYERGRGTIKKWGYDLNPATRNGVSILSNVAIKAAGVFDFLARAEFIPGVHGDTPPSGHEDSVYYVAGEVATGTGDPGDGGRIERLLDDAGLVPDRYVVFSGNVNVRATEADAGDPILTGLRDAADAETPSALANIYEDRHGRFVFHGRQAKLDPATVAAGAGPDAWDYQEFKIGDGAAIDGDPDYAQMRPPFNYRVDLGDIINRALVIPRGIDRSTIPGLLEEDATSIDDHGPAPFTYQDSINAGHKTNGDTAAQDCQRSAQFLVGNFKDPLVRIEGLTIKAMRPGDARADQTWRVLSKADISDSVRLTVGYPGGTGIDGDYFIEGWTQTITPMNGTHDWVELTLNLSPRPTFNPYDD